MLMDEGKISPEDELRKFVPEMHRFDPPIRIQDLVRCRTGLWEQVAVPALVGWENRAPSASLHGSRPLEPDGRAEVAAFPAGVEV